MIDWPESFILPSAAYNVDTAPNTVTTQMENGARRTRRRSTVEQVLVNVQWEMSDVEYTVFVGFHKHILQNGSEWFRIKLALGSELQYHIARFVNGNYGNDYIPVGYWNVTAQLEIQQRATLSKDIIDVYVAVGFSDEQLMNFMDSVENARIVTNETLPSILN